MKIKLPNWKSGSCLPNCIIGILDFKEVDTSNILNKYGPKDYMWPAEAGSLLGGADVTFEVFDNDVDFIKFVDKGEQHILEKYGEFGLNYMRKSFKDIGQTILQTQDFLNKYESKYKNNLLNFKYLKTLMEKDKNCVAILTLNSSTIRGQEGYRPHYYLADSFESKEDKFIIYDPIYPETPIPVTFKLLEEARKTMNNEVIDFIIYL